LKFANKLIKVMFSDNELYKVKEKTKWDEGANDWKVPKFYFQGKEVQFPTINAG